LGYPPNITVRQDTTTEGEKYCTPSNSDDTHMYCQLPSMPYQERMYMVQAGGPNGVGFLGALQYANTSSSSSSTGGSVPVPRPVIRSVLGCGGVSESTRTTSGCVGDSSTIFTIAGLALSPSLAVSLQGLSRVYECPVLSPASNSTALLCTSPLIYDEDVNRTLTLTVSTAGGTSDGWTVVFSQGGEGEVWKFLGLTLAMLIGVLVVLLLVTVLLLLCCLSCLCGVSLSAICACGGLLSYCCGCCCGAKQQEGVPAGHYAMMV
jgi:hypothetical protein